MISGMNKTTMLFIKKMLNQCQQCVGFYGAVMSSPDGLLLASSGHFSGDEAAAAASSIMVDASKGLSMIAEAKTQEILIWSEDKLFSIRRLKDDSILMIGSEDLACVVDIRFISEKVSHELDMALNILG